MKWALLCLALLACPTIAAQTSGPTVVPVVHHPFPDDADPLGFPFAGGRDGFWTRHGHLPMFRDGIAFPGIVVDGLEAMEGLPDGDDPEAATQTAYESMVARRLAEPTPAVIEVATRVVDNELRYRVASEGSPGGEPTWWVALVEHPVRYQPPAALSNGVFEHPFTLRNLTATGSSDPVIQGVMPLAGDPERSWLAVWLQRDAQPLAGTPREVVQAALHPVLQEVPTRQEERAVLVELYSASWCDPCLFGDRAIEELAAAHGVSTQAAEGDEAGYWRAPSAWTWPLVLTAGALLAVVPLPGRRP